MTLGTTTYKSHELKNENMIYELTLTYTPLSTNINDHTSFRNAGTRDHAGLEKEAACNLAGDFSPCR